MYVNAHKIVSTRARIISLTALLLAGLATLIVGFVYFGSPREPSYQGKSLSDWIVPFCRQTTNGVIAPGGPQVFQELQPVRNAVSQMGTKAVPLLIAKLNYRESALHQKIRDLADKQPIAGLRLDNPQVRQIRAIRALAVLGPQGRAAIPALSAQINDPVLSQHAIYALAGMGSEGIRVLVDRYTNASAPARIEIALSLTDSIYRGENATPIGNRTSVGMVVDGLGRIAGDTTAPYRIPAIMRLGAFGAAASNAVPALVKNLDERSPMIRQMSIRTIGQIKARPDLAIPALTNLLSDPDPGTRMAAAFTLQGYGYNTQFQPPMPHQFRMPEQLQLPGQTNFVRPSQRVSPPPVPIGPQ